MGARTSKKTQKAAALAMGFLTFVISTSASSYEIRETETGEIIRWDEDEIQIVLDSSLSALGPLDEVEEVVIRSFEKWADTARLPIVFTFVEGHCDKSFSDDETENQNCVMAVDGDLGEDGNTGARTSVAFDLKTGSILDADIVINSTIGSWSYDGAPETIDLRHAITHEVGHLLGLGHSEVDAACMSPIMPSGQPVGYSLYPDDIEGAGALYGEGAADEFLLGDCLQQNTAVPGRPSGWLPFILAIVYLMFRRIQNQRNERKNSRESFGR